MYMFTHVDADTQRIFTRVGQAKLARQKLYENSQNRSSWYEMKWNEMKWKKTTNAPKSSVSRAQRRCKSEPGSIIIVHLKFQFVDM